MLNLLEFFIRYKYWFVFLILEACSLIMLFRFNSYQGSVWLSTANTVVGNYYDFTSGIVSFFNLGTVNKELTADNTQLMLRVSELEQRLEELSLGDVQRCDSVGKYTFVDAQVVNATLHRVNNLITINRGTADGIAADMPVVCSQGVVGVVTKVSDHFALVMPLINLNSHVSCRLKDSQYFGMMQWQHGEAGISYVADVPRHAEVKVGEIVETNGYSDIFPAGLPIGKVLDFEDSADGMAYLLRVELFTDFATLRNVAVINNYVNSERKTLEIQ